ncbi:Flap endonuclease 1 [Gracilariopsis chorda]|uniref:Flap endonuclease 1 n=1 Tax=Gracilariopsis chorda TaxID=448386 RepID=A0A2V3IXA3_9FLOR|nr:Flap endonuclease 1 [Gracilariopsis chorda]|eukprot:PXF46786.1 Flap endonuclease 1 [Gracilariopsis chorda]
MGIKGLTKLIGDNAPRAINTNEIHSLFGRKIAIDASMCIYQLLVAVRVGADNLTNDEGEVTSHLNGLFYRTIRLLEIGIKPVYVFDGAPPTMKSGELTKRAEAKKAAEEAAKKAREEGDLEMAEKFSRRVNRVTPAMIDSCKRLVRAMGVPAVEAPCEAEAQCAELVKNGDLFATASEDMDSLTFGTSRLIRYLWAGTASTASKKGIKPTEFALDVVLQDLDLTLPQFIDLCILCGCDYVDGIKGVGVVKALNLIRKHGDLQKVVDTLKKEKSYTVPDPYPVEVLRQMFVEPIVTPAKDVVLKWKRPDVNAIKKLMIEENQFDSAKIENGIKRLLAAKQKTSQVRVDSFFKRATAPNEAERAAKRKAVAETNKKSKKSKTQKSSTSTKGRAAKAKKDVT